MRIKRIPYLNPSDDLSIIDPFSDFNIFFFSFIFKVQNELNAGDVITPVKIKY